MAVTPNNVQVSFTGGIDTKSEPHLVQPPRCVQLTNYRQTAAGGIQTRVGMQPQTTVGNGQNLTVAATNEELLVADNQNLFAYAGTTQTWLPRGAYGNSRIDLTPITNMALENSVLGKSLEGGIRNLSFAVIGNSALAVWDTGSTPHEVGTDAGGPILNVEDAGTVYAGAFDLLTGKYYWTQKLDGPGMALPLPLPATSWNPQFTVGRQVLGGGFPSFGAGSPYVVAYQNNYTVAWVRTELGSDSETWVYSLVIVQFAPTSGGVSQQMTAISGSGANFPMVYSTKNVNDGLTGWGAFGRPDPPLTFSMGTNDTSLVIAVNTRATWRNQSDPVYSAVSPWLTLFSTNGPANIASSWWRTTTSSVVPYASGRQPRGWAYPLTVTMKPDMTVGAVVSQAGVTPFKVNANGSASFASTVYTYEGTYLDRFAASAGATFQVVDAHFYGLLGMPVAGGITGTDSAYTLHVTDGFLYNKWDGSQTTLSNRVSTVPQLRQGNIHSTYKYDLLGHPSGVEGPVGSNIVFMPTEADPAVLEPCLWVYGRGATPDSTTTFTNMVLMRLASGKPIGRALYLRAYPPRYTSHPGSMVQRNAKWYTLAVQLQNIVDNVGNLSLVTLADATYRQVVPLPQGALLTGADTAYYDGAMVRSAGWLKIPELSRTPQVTVVTGFIPGSLIENFTYTYFIVYVDYDRNGNAIYSSPSPPYFVTPFGGSRTVKIALTDVFPGDTNSSIGTQVHVYRNSKANPLQYFRVGVVKYPFPPSPASTSDPSGTFVDSGPDDLSGQPLLYSPPNGGELPNDPPPPSTFGVSTKSRVFVVSAENPTWIYPSKPFFPGRVPEFNAAQYLDIDPSTGPIKGLAALDENIVVFKEKAIYLLSGPGPDATGNGNFNPLSRLSTDAGLRDPFSLVTTDAGVYFRSERGIQLLNRGFAINYVGAPIETYLRDTTGPHIVVAAMVVPQQSQVRFILSNNNVLVYDYTMQSWSVYLYNLQRTLAPAGDMLSATLWDNKMYLTTTDGFLWAEQEPYPTNYMSTSSPIPADGVNPVVSVVAVLDACRWGNAAWVGAHPTHPFSRRGVCCHDAQRDIPL